jgi:hypothetical protein
MLALGPELGCRPVHPAEPFSSAEIDRALLPVKLLRKRCYDVSRSARAATFVSLDFSLDIRDTGEVRSSPKQASVEDPELIECVRHALDEIRFPARGREWLRVHLELGNPRASG